MRTEKKEEMLQGIEVLELEVLLNRGAVKGGGNAWDGDSVK